MMSKIGIWLIENINRIVPPQKMHQELHEAKLSDCEYQRRDYEEAEYVIGVFGKYWDVRGKQVLDVGGGLGGKAIYYAEQGARSVVTLDLRSYSNNVALSLAREKNYQEVIHPTVADAANAPFVNGAFDVIISVNAFEHVRDVQATLDECKRVLHSSGQILLYFPPFYSPWGAHLEGWINFPWPHIFFSEHTLIQAAKKIERQRSRNVDYIAPSQVDWESAEQLPGLNRITAREFFKIVQALDLKILEVKMLPFGWRHFSQSTGLSRLGFTILQKLSQLPLFREGISTKMVFVLSK